MLGAKIGKKAIVKAKVVCTDLVEIGQNSVIRDGSIIDGYKAEAGFIKTGENIYWKKFVCWICICT